MFDGEFDWSAQEQGIILGGYYYGFIATVLPGGIAAEKFGGKIVIFLAVAGSALCSILCPVAARFGGSAWLIAVRILQGLASVSILPPLCIWVFTHSRSHNYSGARRGRAKRVFSGIWDKEASP